jgi:hypothetical protein
MSLVLLEPSRSRGARSLAAAASWWPNFNRPRDSLQWALFAWIQQPLDGFLNTRPHRDGRFEQAVRATFGQVHSAAVARTIAGTVETFVCVP